MYFTLLTLLINLAEIWLKYNRLMSYSALNPVWCSNLEELLYRFVNLV